MNLIEIGKKAVSIDSSFGQGTKDVVEYLCSTAKTLGLHAEVYTEILQGCEQSLLWVTLPTAEKKPELLLVSHLDTLEPGEYLRWSKTGANPFQLSLDGDLVYGLGVADAKLDFVSKLLALSQFTKLQSFRVSPVVVGTFGAESSQGLIRLFRKKKFKPAGALVGRPTDLKISSSGPGFALIEIAIPFDDVEKKYRENHDLIENSHSQSKVFSSYNKHGMEFDFYDNPIVKALEYLKNLPEGLAVISVDGGTAPNVAPDIAMLELDIVDGFGEGMLKKLIRLLDILKNFSAAFRSVSSDGFVPAHSTFNVGQILTDSEQVKISGSCRIVPAVTQSIYEEWLSHLRRDCEKIGARFHVVDYKAPFLSAANGNLFSTCSAAAQALDLESGAYTTALASEASFFSRIGCECYVFGAGQGVVSSQVANEQVKISDCNRATDFYKKVIEGFCL